jgi:ABC-2 type transport system permease protein
MGTSIHGTPGTKRWEINSSMAIRDVVRAFKDSIWLGWKIDANWTDPWLFAVYSVIRPISGMLIVIFLFFVGSQVGGEGDPKYLTYLFVGNTFFTLVTEMMLSMGWVIHEDREHYEVLKYIYISPVSLYVYLLGRACSTALIALISVFISILFGVTVLQMPINFLSINYPALALSLVIGLVAIASFGLILASIALLTARHGGGLIGQAVAGIFYLFCGIIFPVSALPQWAQAVSKILPLTYWMNMVRDSMFGAAPSEIIGNLPVLAGFTVLFYIVSLGVLKLADYLARDRGLIDITTEH